jgi:PKD repeat protein
LVSQAYGVSYFVDGYVVVEDLYIPVENQIIEIRNQSGNILSSALSDESGYYAVEINQPAAAQFITLSFSRNCSGELVFYTQQLSLDNSHLGFTFLVCEDKACEAGFNYEQQSRNSLVFEFTNISKGNIDQFFWNFGDGHTSTDENPVHEFDTPNDYIVSLTINGANCTDAVARQLSVDYRECLSKFSFVQANQGQQLVLEFKNESQGNKLQYYWQFGALGNSFETNPSYAFNTPGDYLITLNVASQGCFHSLAKTVTVSPLSQSFALFKNEQLFSPELRMQFTDLSVGEDILYWVWLFGDGASSEEQNPEHIYEQPGVYPVSLRLISAAGQGFYTFDVEVIESTGCLADFVYTQPDPDNPHINFNSLTANGNLQFLWNFGDGDSSTEKSPAHQYDGFGNYLVSLEVLGYGCTDNYSALLVIEQPEYCDAKFTYQQAFPQSREISFIDQSFGNDIAYLWDFGDGNTSALASPFHAYETAGQFPISLHITSAQNCSDSAFATVNILPPLEISGNVFAGEIPMSQGYVLLYRITESQQTLYYRRGELDAGHYQFTDIPPANYFIQAIPDFEFPFPLIPVYYPVYANKESRWQEAEIIFAADLPATRNLSLGSYDGFFDGKASISGRVVPEKRDSDTPLIIYLSSNTGEIFQFRILDEDMNFSFADIPYGKYKLRPEKAGKISTLLEVSLDDNTPRAEGISFIESSETIVPDISNISEISTKLPWRIAPNPASTHIQIIFTKSQSNLSPRQLRIFSSQGRLSFFDSEIAANEKIDIHQLPAGLYLVEVFDGEKYDYQKLLIRH